jgi:ribonuclease P protein component
MLNTQEIRTFPKEERLRSRRVMARLFDRNAKDVFSFLVYPYRIVLLEEEDTEACFPEILISVPKRIFKKAVHRNKIKRLTREAYRIQKKEFSKKLYIGLLYVGKELTTFEDAKKSLHKVLSKLESRNSPPN